MLTSPVLLTNSELKHLAIHVRKSVFEICLTAQSGHIGGCSGAVELMLTLYFGGILKYNVNDSCDNKRDRVLVRGHLGPLRYKIFSLIGYLDKSELSGYRRFGTRLHGHEDHLETPGVDITPSGSLGMLLSYGVGSAIVAKNLEQEFMTYVFLGDGEEQEGNVSEAARHAANLKLNNLIVIIDKNTKQLSDPVCDIDSSDLTKIWEGYGWIVINLSNGHDVSEIREAYHKAKIKLNERKCPVVIIANTCKGYGINGAVDHFSGYHTISTCPEGVVEEAINFTTNDFSLNFSNEKLVTIKGTGKDYFQGFELNIKPLEFTPNNPDQGQVDYFRQLAKQVESRGVTRKKLYFLTADVTRQDHVKLLRLRDFCTYMNVGIREQHMIAMAHGISVSDSSSRIIINSLDAFTYRCIDQINAAVQGKSNMVIIGDVAGLTNAKNGKTHQTSGQPGAILAMPGVCFLEPWDVIDTFNCLNWAIGESRGIVFIRIHSADVSVGKISSVNRTIDWYVVYKPEVEPIQATMVTSGLVVGHAINAAKALLEEGVSVKVINVVNHKSLDTDFVLEVVPHKPLLTIYNGVAEVMQGNISKVLLEIGLELPSKVRGIGFNVGTTGSVDDLLAHYGLNESGIIRTLKSML